MKTVQCILLATVVTWAQLPADSYNENMWITNGTVRTIALDGNTAYIGGHFNYFGPYTGNVVLAGTTVPTGNSM